MQQRALKVYMLDIRQRSEFSWLAEFAHCCFYASHFRVSFFAPEIPGGSYPKRRVRPKYHYLSMSMAAIVDLGDSLADRLDDIQLYPPRTLLELAPSWTEKAFFSFGRVESSLRLS